MCVTLDSICDTVCTSERPLAASRSQAALDFLDLLVVQGLELEQRVDEEAVALVGRNAAGGGVRRGDEAQILEVGHDVADGGRGEAQARIARQGSRADGLPVANVILDQGLEQQLRPLVESFIATFCHSGPYNMFEAT